MTTTTTYGDCGTCQNRQPASSNSINGVEGIYCRTCGRTIVTNVLTITAKYNRTATQCGTKCLTGRRSCDCRCHGRCHGAGSCHCLEVAA